MNFSDSLFSEMLPRMENAFTEMTKLESGAIANPDENRMVGHYWLRKPSLAPNKEIETEINQTFENIKKFAAQIHSGEISVNGNLFKNLLIVGIGGSALGPQFVGQALTDPQNDKMEVYFFDNTDPDGIDLTLAKLDGKLNETLVLVISKSGGTPETRNGMIEAENAFKNAGLNFSKHTVAITGNGSKLDKYAEDNGWLKRFPMWDWVGGRTSEIGPVGLIPAALMGINIDEILQGAAEMDQITRRDNWQNPAALLALMWYYATDGRGSKDMVILPYKDRLMLFSKYLQQLVMESLGKEFDLNGNVVNQGIAVYGNKGSTDQHAYVQQLREGVCNFFVTFIEVQKDREGSSVEVEPGVNCGDYLKGLLLGTRSALYEKGRESITICIDNVNGFSVGLLIALYERAVGLYASLININAYHQPGVEAGKKAAASVIQFKKDIMEFFNNHLGDSFTLDQIAKLLKVENEKETLFKLIQHLAVNNNIIVKRDEGQSIFETKYCFEHCKKL